LSPYNATYGISAGGRTATAGPIVDKFERATYSTETNATNTAVLTATLALYSQTIATTLKAMMCGGDTDTGGGGRTTTIRSYTYASDTAATSAATLSNGGRWKSGGGMGLTIGYIFSGMLAAASTTTEKITIATDTCVAGPTATTTPSSDPSSKGAGNDVYIYFSGWNYTAKLTDRIAFATNTLASSGTFQSYAHSSAIRTNPEGTIVYKLGGTGADNNKRDKFTLSTETSSALSNLSTVISNGHPAGSSTKMYNVGGYDSTWSNLAQGMTYSTEVMANVTGMNSIATSTWAGGV
jgi:hypothetical protein